MHSDKVLNYSVYKLFDWDYKNLFSSTYSNCLLKNINK